KLTLTVLLTRAQAERLTARAIREGKNLDALVAEILGAASGWSSVRRKPAVTWRRVDAHKTQEGAPYGITTDVGMGRVGGRHPAGARLDLRRPDRSWRVTGVRLETDSWASHRRRVHRAGPVADEAFVTDILEPAPAFE